MDKTVQDVLDDHLSLCVLAYARLSVRHNEPDKSENRESDVMKRAIQAASLFTVASMNALGDSGHTARALDLAREMFRELEDSDFIGEACAASLGILENVLLNTDETLAGGVVSENDASALNTTNARSIPSRQKRRKTPPSP